MTCGKGVKVVLRDCESWDPLFRSSATLNLHGFNLKLYSLTMQAKGLFPRGATQSLRSRLDQREYLVNTGNNLSASKQAFSLKADHNPDLGAGRVRARNRLECVNFTGSCPLAAPSVQIVHTAQLLARLSFKMHY